MTTTTTATDRRAQILDALAAFVRQRPGLEFGDYCAGWDDQEGRRAYLCEVRAITRDLHEFRALLAAVQWRATEQDLVNGFEAFGGRLILTQTPEGVRLDYQGGQYWPTEYRRAACAVLGSALFDYVRRNLQEAGKLDVERPGPVIRAELNKMIGARLTQRWAMA